MDTFREIGLEDIQKPQVKLYIVWNNADKNCVKNGICLKQHLYGLDLDVTNVKSQEVERLTLVNKR